MLERGLDRRPNGYSWFASFPTEESKHMREIVIDETLQDMDKDKDGFVTLEEYISKCEGAYANVCAMVE